MNTLLEENYLNYPSAVKEAMGLKVDYPAGSSEVADIIIKGKRTFTFTEEGQEYSEEYYPYIFTSEKELVNGDNYIIKIEEQMEYYTNPGHDNGDGSFTMGTNEVAYLEPGLYQCACAEKINSLNYYLVSPHKHLLEDYDYIPFPDNLEICLSFEKYAEEINVHFPAEAYLQLVSNSGLTPSPGGGDVIIKDPGRDSGGLPGKVQNP